MPKIILSFLTDNKRSIIESFPFFQDYIKGKVSPLECLRNLELFTHDLISKGFSQVDIDALKNFILRPISLKSIDNWKKWWKHQGIGTTNWVKWYFGNEIRVFKMPEVSEAVSRFVVDGYKSLIDDLNIQFEVKYFGVHPSATVPVRACIRLNNKLDAMSLHALMAQEDYRKPEKGGKPHADVIIVSQFLIDNSGWWGATSFDCGSSVISVPNERQGTLEFIKKVSKHECAHLLGYGPHHDDTNAKVIGYPEPQDCLTYHRCSSYIICQKCKDAIISFWQGIGERSQKRFFKGR